MTRSQTTEDKALTESAADVTALIPKYSWELMDEEQRDALMEQIVLPRYMKSTSDGVQLGPMFWAEAVGASSGAIQKRIERLQAKAIQPEDETTTSLPEWKKADIRAAKQLLRESEPNTLRKIVRDLPRKQREHLSDAAHDVTMDEIHAKQAEHSTTPTAGELMGDDRFDPSEYWADTLVIRVHNNARELAGLMKRAGGLLFGTMSPDEAFDYLFEAERLVAEARAAAQEQVRDRTEV